MTETQEVEALGLDDSSWTGEDEEGLVMTPRFQSWYKHFQMYTNSFACSGETGIGNRKCMRNKIMRENLKCMRNKITRDGSKALATMLLESSGWQDRRLHF